MLTSEWGHIASHLGIIPRGHPLDLANATLGELTRSKSLGQESHRFINVRQVKNLKTDPLYLPLSSFPVYLTPLSRLALLLLPSLTRKLGFLYAESASPAFLVVCLLCLRGTVLFGGDVTSIVAAGFASCMCALRLRPHASRRGKRLRFPLPSPLPGSKPSMSTLAWQRTNPKNTTQPGIKNKNHNNTAIGLRSA